MLSRVAAPGIDVRRGATLPDSGEGAGAWWVVCVLFLIYILSYLDRTVINLVVEPIRHSLGVSDFQISLLQGFGFATFYALFGLPLGWLVDRGYRRIVIFGGVVVWSISASACGLATEYWHLLLGRIGTGAGEAALAPAAFALLSELFPRHKLALPLSIVGAGAPIGASMAFVAGGLLIAALPPAGVVFPVFGLLEPWQAELFLTGLPGLVLAPLVFTIRAGAGPPRASPPAKGSIRSALRSLVAERRFYSSHFLGFATVSLCGYATQSWLPAFLARTHGWSIGDAAVTTGMLALFCMVPGAAVLGTIADRWFARGRHDAHLRLFAITLFLQALAIVFAFLASDVRITLGLIALEQFLGSGTGVAAAAIQITTKPHLRGQISALYLLVYNLVGAGLGPTAVAVFTDFVLQDVNSVGWSIALTHMVFAPIGCMFLMWGGKPMRRLIANASHADQTAKTGVA